MFSVVESIGSLSGIVTPVTRKTVSVLRQTSRCKSTQHSQRWRRTQLITVLI